MLHSSSKRLLFIHTQKTGGETVSRVLQDNLSDVVRLSPSIHKHAMLRDAQPFLPLGVEDLRVWAMVRNPWDRLVSWYAMIAEARRIPFWYARSRSRLGSHFRQSRSNPVWRYVYENSSTFDEFLRNCTATINTTSGSTSFVRNQYDYLALPDDRAPGLRVGRFERFADEVRRLLSDLGFDPPGIPHENRSRHGDYRDYYSASTRDLVAERFARDIEYFGYQF